MALLFWYVGFVVAGDVLAYSIGRFVEYELGSNASLIVFLTLYFLSLGIVDPLGMDDRTKEASRSNRTHDVRPHLA